MGPRQATDVQELTEQVSSVDVRYDVSLAYRLTAAGGTQTVHVSTVDEAPPQDDNVIVEAQNRYENYIPFRNMAHVASRLMSNVQRITKEIAKKNADDTKAAKAAKAEAKAQGVAAPAETKQKSAGKKTSYKANVYTAYMQAPPVHLIMLCNFVFAFDESKQKWVTVKGADFEATKHTEFAPMIYTSKLPERPFAFPVCPSKDDKDLSHRPPLPYCVDLASTFDITMIHVPLAPTDTAQPKLWGALVRDGEMRTALEGCEMMRKWLHYYAHTEARRERRRKDSPSSLRDP